MIGILDWIFGREPVKVKAPMPRTRPARNEMTLDRWQQDAALVNWARTSEEFAYLLSMVINQQPSGFPMRGQAVTDIQCAVELGRKEGYADCENVLFAARQLPAKPVSEIEADYDDTEYKTVEGKQ